MPTTSAEFYHFGRRRHLVALEIFQATGLPVGQLDLLGDDGGVGDWRSIAGNMMVVP